jgi:hypothetical protein
MSDSDDTDGVLHRFISDDHAERLLAGNANAGDDGLAPVAGLFAALRAPSQASELAGTDGLVARMAAAVSTSGAVSAHPSRRKPVLAKVVTGKIAALAAVAFFSAGAAAAATGNLPDPLQRTVSKTFSHVGVDLPAPAGKPIASTTTASPTTTAASTTTSTAEESDSTIIPTTAADETTNAAAGASVAVGPDATGPAKKGLCTAYFANDHGKNLDAVAFRNLTDAATAAGQTVEEFCAPKSDTTTTNTSETPTTDEHGKPTDKGHGKSTPAATAPGHGGSSPSATTPGHSGSTAATTPTSSHGRP